MSATNDENATTGARARRTAKRAARRPGSLGGGAAQRARILSAARELAHEDGYDALSVSALIARARVSSKTFYEHFESAESCFAATFDEAIAEITALVMPVYQRPGPWLMRVREGLRALLVQLDREPALATLLFVEAQRAGAEVQERRARTNELLTAIAGGGRSVSPMDPPALADEVLVGGTLSVIRARLSRPCHAPLASLLDELMAVLAHTYLGDAGLGELPSARAGQTAGTPARSTQASVPVRMTYRTLRVLGAIAERPGASNREVARAAGIADPGQISRLLARLHSSGLIVNESDGNVGTPNAWLLSPEGEAIRQTTRNDFRGGQGP